MTDIGPRVVAACREAQVPCWRAAWQGGQGSTEPPPVYAVFTVSEAPGDAADDGVTHWTYWVYLNIYGKGNVRAAGDRVVERMKAAGFLLIDRRDEYDRQAASNMDVMSWQAEVDI